jgi:hypothetical protein
MNKKLFLLLVVLLSLVLALPTLAITFGEPDGNAHPFVGAIVLEFPDGGMFQACSGTLIDEDVFLTAAHCRFGVQNDPNFVAGSKIWVTFDPTIDLENGVNYEITFDDWFANPNFNGFSGQYGNSDPGDVAVIVLPTSPGIVPARLPEAGLLDQIKLDGTLKNTRFTAVGYGTVRDSIRKGFEGIYDNLDRNRAEQSFLSLTSAWLTLSMNTSTGNGGTCYGDSGGPHFIHLDGQETDIVASITVTGDAPCKATDKTYRMDTDSARSFLGNFIDLP